MVSWVVSGGPRLTERGAEELRAGEAAAREVRAGGFQGGDAQHAAHAAGAADDANLHGVNSPEVGRCARSCRRCHGMARESLASYLYKKIENKTSLQ